MRSMRVLRSHRFAVVTAVAAVGASGVWVLARESSSPNSAVVARVKRGPFVVTVTTAGELRAKKFVQVTAPPQLQQAGVYQIKIASLVPEGTVVKQGDQVAELDRSALASKLADVTLALQKAEAQYEQAQLDSALNLSGARESIRTMELGLEEKKLAKEEAVYEAPTVKRQAEIDYEKAERALAQAKTDYETKTEQARAKMREVGADLARQKNTLKVVQEAMAGCTVKAPGPGMVIYSQEWNGKKRTAGSQVAPWDPTVATLPDLTEMESLTYVNEIDVRKVAVGQPAVITLDADPSKRFAATVSSVANVGEQRPSADAKVFEVKVTLAQADTTLRPGMTTGNAIDAQGAGRPVRPAGSGEQRGQRVAGVPSLGRAGHQAAGGHRRHERRRSRDRARPGRGRSRAADAAAGARKAQARAAAGRRRGEARQRDGGSHDPASDANGESGLTGALGPRGARPAPGADQRAPRGQDRKS